ncbi:MAG: hypothetical protein L0241_20505 [Planctomycetia bacterium]|nr:hypothetical protein [Planctomycetia bacterium]
MLASAMKKGFPKGVTLPAELRALCDFADEQDGEVSGLFEFQTEGQTFALAWFNREPEPAKQFAVFGYGPDGSLYALWLHDGLKSDKAPVVMLDSECQDSKVIARDFREFLRLLAIGYDEPGRYPTLEPENPKSAAKLRKWLKAEYGLVPPKTGDEIVTEAQGQHPDLMAWIREWQKRHLGTV